MAKIALLVLVGLLAVPRTSLAGDVPLVLEGQRLSKRVKTFKELRQEGLTLQEQDYSCGAAALATILTSHFGDRVKEAEVIGFIFIHGQTPEEGLRRYFQRQGFSLLDLKRFAEFRGYKVAGFKGLEFSDLVEFLWQEKLPVLVPISPFGYHHFVVVTGIQGNRVFYADPALGRMTMTLARFSDVWVDGVGLVISRTELAYGADRSRPREQELGQISGTGVAERSTPGPVSTESPLLTSGPGQAMPDPGTLVPLLERGPESVVFPRLLQTFGGSRDVLFTRFEVQNYNPVIQFGDPPGNFIDFTPPKGAPIAINQNQ